MTMTIDVSCGAPKVELMGVRFDPLTEREAIDRILASMTAGTGGCVVTPNIDILRQAAEHPELVELIHQADLVLADGMPLVWVSHIQGPVLPQRVAGSSLASTLSRAAAAMGVPVFLLGGNPGVAERAAAQLTARIPGLVVGHHYPPFGFESNPAAGRAIDDAIDSFGPAIYYCGLGFPKQEHLMLRLRERFTDSWFIGSGASLSFLAGETRRAPLWMQQSGLEWLHRLGQEPHRLFRRYILEDIPFATRMVALSLVAAAKL